MARNYTNFPFWHIFGCPTARLNVTCKAQQCIVLHSPSRPPLSGVVLQRCFPGRQLKNSSTQAEWLDFGQWMRTCAGRLLWQHRWEVCHPLTPRLPLRKLNPSFTRYTSRSRCWKCYQAGFIRGHQSMNVLLTSITRVITALQLFSFASTWTCRKKIQTKTTPPTEAIHNSSHHWKNLPQHWAIRIWAKRGVGSVYKISCPTACRAATLPPIDKQESVMCTS